MPSGEDLVTISAATPELARRGVNLSEAALKQAADRGDVPATRTADRGVRLFRVADLHEFARSRSAR